MLIVWGTKASKRKLGRVADYCRRCRDARAFRLIEERRVSHLYYISLGRGTVVGHTIICECCRRAFPIDPGRYRGAVKNRRATLEALCDQTNPTLPEQIAARLDAVDRVVQGAASPEDRYRLIADAFVGVLPDYEKRASEMHIDVWTALSFFVVIVAAIAVGMVAMALQWPDDLMVKALFVAIAATLTVTIVLLVTDARRFYRRRTLPELVRELTAIQPTAEELDQAKVWLQRQGAKLHKRVDPTDMAARIVLEAESQRL